MAKIIIILVALLLTISMAQLVVLNDSNYTKYVETNKLVFVKFYMPDCSHCMAMADEYKKLAELSLDKEYKIAEVDITKCPGVHHKVKIQRFPAMKFLLHGHSFDYKGNRTANAMQSWIQSMMTSEIKQITKEESQNMKQQNIVTIQGGSKQQLQILAYAQKVNQIPYYHFNSDQFAIILYLQRSKKLAFNKNITVKQVSDWVGAKVKGYLIALKSQQIIKQIFQNQQKVPAFLLIKNTDFSDENFQTLSSFCQAYQNKLKCAYADQRHQIYQGTNLFLNIKNNQHSFLIYLDYQIRNGYEVTNPTSITSAQLTQFVEDVKEGKVKKYYDQQASKQQSQIKYEHVTKLNASNFNKTIQQNKCILVQYYSIYCQYCRQFAPQYEALAQKLKQQKYQCIIAAVDLDEQQQIRQYVKVNGYPSLRFYYKREQLDYQGPRNTQSIISFMESVQSNKLKTISNISDIIRPAVVIYGIEQNSTFHLLPFIYNRWPVYQFKGESRFKVQIHQKKYSVLYGQQYLQNIANYLQEETEPSVVNVLQTKNIRKLSTAIENDNPLLVLVNRGDSAEFKRIYNSFESFCSDKLEYLCGIASKDQIEFQNFNKWLNEFNDSKNSLLYIKTDRFQKYVYGGNLNKFNEDDVKQFIDKAKNGKIISIKNTQQIQSTHIEVEQKGKVLQTKKRTQLQSQEYTLDNQL